MESTSTFIFTNDIKRVLLTERRIVYIPRIDGIHSTIAYGESPWNTALISVWDVAGYARDDFELFEELEPRVYPSGTVLHVYCAVLNCSKEFQRKRPEDIAWWNICDVSEEYDSRFAGGGGPQQFVNLCVSRLHAEEK